MGRINAKIYYPRPSYSWGEVRFNRWYDRYQRSPFWQRIREAVFRRSGGVCERCGERDATDAHHLDYTRLGREWLEDMLAVCGSCHEFLHRGSTVAQHFFRARRSIRPLVGLIVQRARSIKYTKAERSRRSA